MNKSRPAIVVRKFLDCVDIVGSTPKPFPGEKIYVSTGAVDETTLCTDKCEKITYSERPSRADLEANVGDVLFAKMQATCKTLLIDKETARHIYSTGFFAVRAKEDCLSPRYLFHFLNGAAFLTQKDRQCVGATQKSLTLEGLTRITVPFPETAQQISIAAVLDQVDALIANYRRQLTILRTVPDAYFDEHFVETCSYPQEPLSEHVAEMHIGPFGSDLKNDSFVPEAQGFCMVYEQKHAIRGTMNVETRYVGKAKHDALKRFEVYGGDIIVSCRGTIGKTFVVPLSAPMGIMHSSIMKIRLKRDSYHPIFFERLLRHHLAREEAKANGSGVKMAVTATILGRTPFMLPPLSEQERFVAFVAGVERAARGVRAALRAAETLKAALVQRYFIM